MAVTVVIATAGAALLTILSVVVYDAALPEDWVGVVAAFLVSAIADGIPVTHAAELVRGPWLGEGWDGQALLYVLAMLAASLGLTAWLLRKEAEG